MIFIPHDVLKHLSLVSSNARNKLSTTAISNNIEHLYLYVMVTQVPLVCIIQQLTGVFVVYGCIIFSVVYKMMYDETVPNEMLLI